MPYHFLFDKTHRILLAVAEGVFDDDDQHRLMADIRANAKALGALAGIGDVSHVTTYAVSPATMQQVARGPSPYAAGVPRYLVAPSDIAFGMSRMYQLASDKSNASLRVVRSREEALADLGVNDAKFERLGAPAEVTPSRAQLV